MSATPINLTDPNRQKLSELSQQTGKTKDELVNEAVEQFAPFGQSTSSAHDWKQAWRQAAGMWKDRADIPGLMAQLKRELNRFE